MATYVKVSSGHNVKVSIELKNLLNAEAARKSYQRRQMLKFIFYLCM